MKIYHSFDEYKKVKKPVLTVGTFDGVHYGHQKIIERLKDAARQLGGETVLLTFFPHPRMILHPEDTSLKLINTIEEKAALLEKAGIDHLMVIPFTRDFSNLSSSEFIEEILVNTIGVKKLIIGYDHQFGKNREGDLRDLKENGPKYGFEVEEIPEQDVNDVAVSSSKIRQALQSGDIATANQYLGYPFFIRGKVVKGDQLGKKLGYPTANLYLEETYKLVPADGIYAVHVWYNGREHEGLLYIGHRPTLNGMTHNVEAHIFDFDRELYHEQLQVDLLHFIRDDMKFESLEALIAQMDRDKEDALRFFRRTDVQ